MVRLTAVRVKRTVPGDSNGKEYFPQINGANDRAAAVKNIIEQAGLSADSVRVHAKKAVDTRHAGSDEGWQWYCVFVLQDGTVGVTSGPGSDPNINGHGNFRKNGLYTDYQKCAIARAMRGEGF